MPVLPPVTMTLEADTSQFLESIDIAKKAVAGFKPSDYQIRHDALRLAVQAAAADKSILTPGVFSEWQAFFEQALRLAL